MAQNLFEGVPLAHIDDQYFAKEVFSVMILEILGKIEVSLRYLFVCFFDPLSLEWSSSHKH